MSATRPKTPARDATTAMITVRLEDERPEEPVAAMAAEGGLGEEVGVLVGVRDDRGSPAVELSTRLWVCRISGTVEAGDSMWEGLTYTRGSQAK